MSDAQRPIGRLLASAQGPAWEDVEQRLHRRRRRRRVGLALGPALLALAVLFVRSKRPPAVLPTVASLTRLDGTPLSLGALTARALTLSDRSVVTITPETSMRLVINRPERIEFSLQAGRASFEVTPNGPRQWRVECGLATVTVVGTGFEIIRSSNNLHVTVRHGAVRVDGAAVENRTALLTAGASLDVRAPDETRVAHAFTPPTPAPLTAPRPTRALLPHPPRLQTHPDASVDVLAQNAQTDATAAPDATATNASDAVEALWARADQARRVRAYARAAPLLASLVERFPASPRAPMAAFLLGRDQLRALSSPGEAAGSFARAIELGLGPEMAQEAWLGLVEARQRAGDHTGAVEAAAQYRRRFPQGVHRAAIDQITGVAR